MQQPGLDARHRDKDGEISHKHGDTLIGTLRKICGDGFVAGCPDSMTLSVALQKMDEPSLSKLRRDHEAGKLGTILH